MIVKVDKNPYDDEPLYTYSKVELKPGLTVLVGRNGSGKTTLQHYLKRAAEKENYKVVDFNNLTDGGSTSLSSALFRNDIEELAGLALSSEGQRIKRNVGHIIQRIGATIRNTKKGETIVVLLDAIDSGTDIQAIVEMKDIFYLAIDDCKERGISIYIIVSANSYEFPNGENCLDVTNGKSMNFADYEDYKNFILKDKTK